MQVAAAELQHEVMIEAVENHMPQVIVIDEIGREQEAVAARTIAERGVQLVGTAHGITLENLLMNPTLSDLVGGIESVTLSDEEARRRGTQKSVLERRAPPTFDVLIEIQDRQRMAVHHNVAAAVDAILRGRPLAPEIRYRDEGGQVRIEAAPQPAPTERRAAITTTGRLPFEKRGNGRQTGRPRSGDAVEREAPEYVMEEVIPAPRSRDGARPGQAIRIYPYGVGRGRLVQAAENLGVPIAIVVTLEEASAVVTLKNYYRKHPQPIAEAERQRIPVYVLRANTVNQMEACLGDIFGIPVEIEDPIERAIAETQEAIRRVLSWCDVRGAAAGHRRGPPHAARDGARSEPGFAQLRQRAAAPRAHLSRLIAAWACSSRSRGLKAAARPRRSACWPTGSRSARRDVLTTREPGGTRIGDAVRDLLLDPDAHGDEPEAEILLFSAARAQHRGGGHPPHLAQGGIVLCDRFADSTLAYQGYGRRLGLDTLREITAFATGGLMPDLTVCLDLPVGEGLRRKQSGDLVEWNRMEREQLAFHERVRQGYLALAAAEPARWVVLDATPAGSGDSGADSRIRDGRDSTRKGHCNEAHHGHREQ